MLNIVCQVRDNRPREDDGTAVVNAEPSDPKINFGYYMAMRDLLSLI